MNRPLRPLALGWAVLLPLAVAAALILLRDVLASTSTALVLVLVVVAVAVRGDRPAGLVAAVVAAAAFDFFLAAPYYTFAIRAASDIEAAVLLFAVGVAVTEVAQWARRELDRAGQREGYLDGVASAARLAGEGARDDDVIDMVRRMIGEVLDLDDCRFSAERPRQDRPQLRGDGGVVWRGREVDVDRDGLPTMDVVELPVRDGAGAFLLTASTRVRRPTLEQRRVAVTLANQVGVTGAVPPR
ncbi:DUF4118 domain-containing protein [Pseudonocardia ailaonensis]|uniref:DUF4118 domain-containing protein n=1 Tax=Pseudonocardia ailaonensis TaxID=367279 RepID=UPI0031DC94A3